MTRLADIEKLTARFLDIVNENNGLIYKVCYMYAVDSEHLKDLYQEVTANIWQGMGSYRGDSKISTWIYRIAINTCVSDLRRNERRPATTAILDEGKACDVVDESHEHAAQLKAMYEMIGLLGKLDKALIMLWLDEYSYDEIASMTGLQRNNVASRLHRIKQRLIRQNEN